MKILKFEDKGKVYNEITKCTPYAKDKETLYKTKYLKIHSFSVIIDWLNSLLICNKILNENNIYEEIKDGLIILKLIKVYNPEVEIRGIFVKAIKKKCAIKNLEKALSIIYRNNPYYYSIVSSIDIYEKKKKKVNMLLLQLFDKFEFQYLKKISVPLLNWYNHTLKKFSLPLSRGALNDPFNILNNNTYMKYKENRIYYNNEIRDINISRENKEKNRTCTNYLKENTKKQTKILKNFATYVLFKDKQECDHMPYIVKEFSDGFKILLIFYRYGYFTKEEIKSINKSDIRNNFFILQSLLRKLNIPIILKNAYLNSHCEVAILLQLKYIQCFIHNNGYEKAIDLKKENYVNFFIYQEENKRDKIKLKDELDNYSEEHDYDIQILDKEFNSKKYIKKVFEEYDKKNSQNRSDEPSIEKRESRVNMKMKTRKYEVESANEETMKDNNKISQNRISGDNKSEIDESDTEDSETGSKETKIFENKGNKNYNKLIKNINNKNESFTFRTDKRENQIEQITGGEKKNKKEYTIENDTKMRKKEIIGINDSIEKDIFKKTPRKEIRKMFYEKIKEHMNSDTTNKNERVKYKIIDPQDKKDEIIKVEEIKTTQIKIADEKNKQTEINYGNIPLKTKSINYIENNQKIKLFKNNIQPKAMHKYEKKKKETLKLENKNQTIPLKKPLNLLDNNLSKMKQNTQKNLNVEMNKNGTILNKKISFHGLKNNIIKQEDNKGLSTKKINLMKYIEKNTLKVNKVLKIKNEECK